jgi:Sec-independent protein translocase protein TatA
LGPSKILELAKALRKAIGKLRKGKEENKITTAKSLG